MVLWQIPAQDARVVTRIYVALASALLICTAIIPATFAQAEDQPPDDTIVETPAEPTLNIVPVGIAKQDWEIVRDIVLSVPSPAEGAIPGAVEGSFGTGGAGAGLTIDGSYLQYSYDCPSGRCRGFATDIWRSLTRETQQAYIDSIMDALIANFPNEPRYAVWLEGQDAKGYLGARVDLASNGIRRYRFMGR